MDPQPTESPDAHRPTAVEPAQDDPIAALAAEALGHRAVRHPLLQSFGSGAFGERTAEVARSYAHWYDGYSRWFPKYLQAVIARLDDPDHRALLAENLAEEQGRLCPDEHATLLGLGIDPATVDGIAHPELFARFRRAIGLPDAAMGHIPEATIEWRASFLGMLRAGSAAYGVGALGLGTETIVSAIYPQLLDGLARVEGLGREDVVFFELHCHVDDQHQEDLLAIARTMVATPEGAADLRRGMNDALDARVKFWDALHAECLERPEVQS